MLKMAVTLMLLTLSNSSGRSHEWADLDLLTRRESLETERYVIQFLSGTECCPANLTFKINEKSSQRIRQVTFPTFMEDYRGMMILEQTKLVVVGWLEYGGWEFIIQDLAKDEPYDQLMNYGFKFSPSRRFLVYRTHYPRMGLPETRRSIVLLYDFQKSKSENYVGKPDPNMTPHNGFPIFPEKNVESNSYSNMLEAGHLYMSPFLWSQDERKVAFIELFSDKNYLILIDIFRDLSSPRIHRIPLSVKNFFTKQALELLPAEEVEEKWLNIEKLEWFDEHTIIAQPRHDFNLKSAVHLPIPSDL